MHPKDRDAPETDYDTELNQIREGNPNRYKDGFKECTFGPDINPTADKHKNRNYEDLLKWGEEKLFKQASSRLNNTFKDMYNFQPEIDPNSELLTKNREGKVENRLIASGKKYTQNLEDLKLADHESMFSPAINWKSRDLAKGKRDGELLKKDNGKTSNVDFWEAVPEGRGNATLYPKKAAKKGLKSKIVENGQELVEKLAKKGFDPCPNYTSPYCKELMACDIPLKTIISRSKKINSKNLAKFKSGQKSHKGQNRSKSKKSQNRGRSNVRDGSMKVSGFRAHSPAQSQISKNSKILKNGRNASKSIPRAKTRSKSRTKQKTFKAGSSRRKLQKTKAQKQKKLDLEKSINLKKQEKRTAQRNENIAKLLPPGQKVKPVKSPLAPTKHRKARC
jgi:hypothetical protein